MFSQKKNPGTLNGAKPGQCGILLGIYVKSATL